MIQTMFLEYKQQHKFMITIQSYYSKNNIDSKTLSIGKTMIQTKKLKSKYDSKRKGPVYN